MNNTLKAILWFLGSTILTAIFSCGFAIVLAVVLITYILNHSNKRLTQPYFPISNIIGVLLGYIMPNFWSWLMSTHHVSMYGYVSSSSLY